MGYELHIDRRHVATFSSTEEAVARARDLLRQHADSQVDILDSETKQPVMPGSSAGWREHLATEIGF